MQSYLQSEMFLSNSVAVMKNLLLFRITWWWQIWPENWIFTSNFEFSSELTRLIMLDFQYKKCLFPCWWNKEIIILSFVKKIGFFKNFYYNSKCNNQLKKIKKNFFWQNSKSWFVYFTETEKCRFGNDFKII